jgi:hypothetical protein
MVVKGITHLGAYFQEIKVVGTALGQALRAYIRDRTEAKKKGKDFQEEGDGTGCRILSVEIRLV